MSLLHVPATEGCAAIAAGNHHCVEVLSLSLSAQSHHPLVCILYTTCMSVYTLYKYMMFFRVFLENCWFFLEAIAGRM